MVEAGPFSSRTPSESASRVGELIEDAFFTLGPPLCRTEIGVEVMMSVQSYDEDGVQQPSTKLGLV